MLKYKYFIVIWVKVLNLKSVNLAREELWLPDSPYMAIYPGYLSWFNLEILKTHWLIKAIFDEGSGTQLNSLNLKS